MKNVCIVLAIILYSFAAVGCRSTRYIPVPESHMSTVERAVILQDSFEMRDSIVIRTEKDTVYVEKWKTRTRKSIVIDTVFVGRTDSVRVPYPVEIQLGKWQRLKLDWFGELCAVLIALISAIIIYIIWKIRRKILMRTL